MYARLVLSFLALFGAASAAAQTDIYVRGSDRLFPIALPRLCIEQGEADAVRTIPDVLTRDLDLSGYFKVLNPNTYIESPGKCVGPDEFAYTDWSVIGAEGLVRGTVEKSPDGIRVQLFLHDVARRQVVLGKEYQGTPDQARRIAHRFANEIMRFFTGKEGVFGTQIAFSSRIGRFKELFVMDMDGSGVTQLTNDRGLAVSSSWSPDGSGLVYTSYRSRIPDLFRYDLSSRRITQITRGAPLEVGAKYSRDGRSILTARTEGRESRLVLLNADGTLARTLTRSRGGIDVSPDWSPDNRRIVFCSNRGGGPQIYTMGVDGRNVSRISFVKSNYCTSPAWSPRGDRIAFVCRAEGAHQIFTVDPSGNKPLQLTTYGNNEDPSWSPNGEYIAFATTFGRGGVFNIAIMGKDGSNLQTITNSRLGSFQPAWGPLLP